MGCLENMNKLFLTCAFLFSLCLFGGCSKDNDDEPEGGKFNASFSVEGSPLDITGLIEDDDYPTRSIETMQVSDGNHIVIPKSLIPNYRQFFK